MSEPDAGPVDDELVTVPSLVADLRDLGVAAGDTLLVHSSLSALGWVCGGAPAVVDALRTVVTDAGTVVVPTHTRQCTDPAGWSDPPVPDAWIERIRETMPPFRPDVTPTSRMGAIPECFRTYPDARRSDHPALSFAAWGADADAVVGEHPLDYPFGEDSPLARVYDLDGDVLLLGVGHGANTSLHLAEHRAPVPAETTTEGGPVLDDGERVWAEYEALAVDDSDFPAVGVAFEREGGHAEGTVGEATATLASQRRLVDFAAGWFGANR